jgi:hypothetical protein
MKKPKQQRTRWRPVVCPGCAAQTPRHSHVWVTCHACGLGFKPPVSRQREYQLRQEKRGRCLNGDGRRVERGGRCKRCYAQWLATRRKSRGYQPWEPGRPGRPPLVVDPA